MGSHGDRGNHVPCERVSGNRHCNPGNDCKEFSAWVGVKHAVAMANGTLALEAALHALELKFGDEVIVSPRTFIASVSSIISVGAAPVFADISPESQNITPESIRSVMTSKTKAILCVHLAGWPCDMEGIMMLAEDHGLYVIEDCAQAHGASYKGRSVGSIGHIGTWSFCQDKIMTTGGEGGMVTTNDRELWSRMWAYKDHGKSWNAVFERKHTPGFRWVHESFGSNFRITEMQAAIGRIQLKRMTEWSLVRQKNTYKIWDAARNCTGLRVPQIPKDIQHAAYKCYVFVNERQLKRGWDRDRIIAEINAFGVPCFMGSCSEVYLEKAFEKTAFRPTERLPVAKKLGESSLMFLVHPTLTANEINQTCQVLRRVMKMAVY